MGGEEQKIFLSSFRWVNIYASLSSSSFLSSLIARAAADGNFLLLLTPSRLRTSTFSLNYFIVCRGKYLIQKWFCLWRREIFIFFSFFPPTKTPSTIRPWKKKVKWLWKAERLALDDVSRWEGMNRENPLCWFEWLLLHKPIPGLYDDRVKKE